MSGHEYDDLDRIAADDALLDVFGALSWDYPPIDSPQPAPNPVPEPRSSLNPADPDPLLGLLQALRADVDSDAPIAVADAELAPVVPLRSRRALRRSAVTAAVAAAVLSVSGVAAAGFSGVGTPLYPLHKAIFGPTASQQALDRAEKFIARAHDHLDGGRLRAADEALDHAEDALTHVDLEEQGSLPAQIGALRDALAAAFAADTAKLKARQDAEDKAAAAKADHGKGSGKSEDEHGKGSGSDDSEDKGSRGHDAGADEHASEGADSSQDSGSDGSGTGSGKDSKDAESRASSGASHGGDSHDGAGD